MYAICQFLVIVVSLCTSVQESKCEDANACRVLFLGNSVFNYHGGVCQSFEGFCEQDDVDFQAVSQLNEPENTHGVEFLGLGRIPLNLPETAANESIHELIQAGGFDYVVVEARRAGYLMPNGVERPPTLNLGCSLPYEQNIEALEQLHQTIVQAGAQTVLYMHPGHQSLVDWKHPMSQIYVRLHDDLESMEIDGTCHPVLLVPASLLWLDGVNRFGADIWYADSNHGTALARYASGCMLFTYLTGTDPRETNFRELPRSWDVPANSPVDSIREEDAAWIWDQVWLYYTTRPR
jgi:hypothetical protein